MNKKKELADTIRQMITLADTLESLAYSLSDSGELEFLAEAFEITNTIRAGEGKLYQVGVIKETSK